MDKIEKLAYLWRYAENYYLHTGSSWQKDRLFKIQKKLQLSEIQTKELEDICWSMGV